MHRICVPLFTTARVFDGPPTSPAVISLGDILSAMTGLSPQAFHILVALADRDQHGYGIMQDVAERTGGKLRLSAGTLYGSIKRLMEQGMVVELRASQRPDREQDDERRRYYRLTPVGRKAATSEMRRMEELLKQARAHGLAAKSN
jgi:DNA-binding PadR family transcriptional regulator